MVAMNIEISDEVGRHLKQLAEARNLTIDELVSAMLDRHDGVRYSKTMAALTENAEEVNATEPEAAGARQDYLAELATKRGISPEHLSELLEKEYAPGTMGRLAQVAIKSGLASKEKVDTSARSREILNSEFADFIDRRIRE